MENIGALPHLGSYPRFVPCTTGSGVENLEFCVFWCGISVFLVSAENGTGVNKKTNITYVQIVRI